MEPSTLLLTTGALFVGTHFLLSHPMRASLVARLGPRGFELVYSIIAIATFLLVIQAWRAMPDEAPMWAVGDGLWIAATVIVLFASILFMGSLIGNPALPQRPGQAQTAAVASPRGVFAITRHPMMWGFALWALAHALVVPTTGQLLLSGILAFLAIAGSAGQDVKKARLMGDAWRQWKDRTCFIPFAGQVSGRIGWGTAIPRPHAMLGGVVLWLAATWGHGALGYIAAGIWRWVG